MLFRINIIFDKLTLLYYIDMYKTNFISKLSNVLLQYKGLFKFIIKGGAQLFKILIADDDSIIRRGLKAIIEKNFPEDFSIAGDVSNGSDALDIISGEHIDLLVTDIKMPVMDGIELIKKISTMNIKTKIIVLSGFDEYKYVRESLKNGAIDYLLKPINKDLFVELLSNLKNEKDVEKENGIQIKLLNEKMEKNKDILKECFLVDLVKENALNKEYIDAKLIEFQINKASEFLIGVIGIDNSNKYKIQLLDNQKESLLNLIKQRIDDRLHTEKEKKVILATYNSEIIVFFINENKCSDKSYDYITSYIQEIKDMDFNGEKYTFTIGLSNVFQSLDNIHISYLQAVQAYESKFFQGINNIIVFLGNSGSLKEPREINIEGSVKSLINDITMGNLDEIQKNIISIMRLIKENVNDSRNFRSIFSSVISSVYEHSEEFKEVEKANLSDEDKLLYNIDLIETYMELEEYVIRTFELIASRINQIRSARSVKLIEKAKEYINENYSRNVSLKSVSENVFLNSTYFSNLFKNETGKNFVDYLVETRINAAKKLLHEPSIKVNEVSRLVGYDETSSFNRAFKRIVGVSPSDYKKIIK